MQNKKEYLRIKRHRKSRMKLSGTSQKPRLVVHRSLKNIQAQIIDDTINKTLVSMSTVDKTLKTKIKSGGNLKAAEFLGEAFGKAAIAKGIKEVVFDRCGYLYHGRVKVLADSLRKAGLVF